MNSERLTIFFRTETLDEDGDVGAGGDGDAKMEAGLTLAGDVDICRWICSPEAKTPPPVALEAHDSCGLFVQAAKKVKKKK